MQRFLSVPKLYLLLMASISMGICVAPMRADTLRFDSTAEVRQVAAVGLLPTGTTANFLYERPALATLIGEDGWLTVSRINDVRSVNNLPLIINDARPAGAATFQNDQGENDDDDSDGSGIRSLRAESPRLTPDVAERDKHENDHAGNTHGRKGHRQEGRDKRKHDRKTHTGEEHESNAAGQRSDEPKESEARQQGSAASVSAAPLVEATIRESSDFTDPVAGAFQSTAGTSLSIGGEALSTTAAVRGLSSLGSDPEVLQTVPNPEPSSIALVVTGLIALAWIRGKRLA